MRYVYVSGPYSNGDQALNLQVAIKAADTLLQAGFFPLCPHLSHFWHLVCPHDYETWMALDLAWLERCDAVVRLPGESPGADREVERANELGIPVYYGIDAFLLAQPERETEVAYVQRGPFMVLRGGADEEEPVAFTPGFALEEE